MTGVLTNYKHHTLAAHDFTLITNLLYRWSYLHGILHGTVQSTLLIQYLSHSGEDGVGRQTIPLDLPKQTAVIIKRNQRCCLVMIGGQALPYRRLVVISPLC